MLNKPIQISKTYLLFSVLWAGFILFATIANARTLARLRISDLFAYDKPIHMFLFGMFAWLLIKTFYANDVVLKLRVVHVACLSSLAFGITTEFLQGFITTTRFFDYYDMLANGLGCMVVWFWMKRKILTI
jgi:hypothetical protein